MNKVTDVVVLFKDDGWMELSGVFEVHEDKDVYQFISTTGGDCYEISRYEVKYYRWRDAK